ncbi:MAG: hypothetical protein OXC45_02025, partial [Gemmatimonadetes bacterium]|nr:hypothetical protein [Gemmatimonadota bacterium]
VEVLAIEEELADRFGPLPEPTSALLDTLQVKILARQLRLSQLQIGQTMTMTLSLDKPLMRTDIERMVTQSPLPLEFALGEPPKIEVALIGNGPQSRLESAKNVLQSLI